MWGVYTRDTVYMFIIILLLYLFLLIFNYNTFYLFTIVNSFSFVCFFFCEHLKFLMQIKSTKNKNNWNDKKKHSRKKRIVTFALLSWL